MRAEFVNQETKSRLQAYVNAVYEGRQVVCKHEKDHLRNCVQREADGDNPVLLVHIIYTIMSENAAFGGVLRLQGQAAIIEIAALHEQLCWLPIYYYKFFSLNSY